MEPFLLAEQMANIGSEIERTISWRKKGRPEIGIRAFERALELLDLTIADAKNLTRLRELFVSAKLFRIIFISIISINPLRSPGSATSDPF